MNRSAPSVHTRLRHLLALLLTLSCLVGGGPALARSVLDLDTGHQPVPLLDWGDFWIDTRGDTTAAQVDGAALPWRPTREDAIYSIAKGQALWVRFTIPPAPDAERWYLEIPYPSMDKVSLFTLDSAGQWMETVAGDTVPVAHWPVPHRYPLMPVTVSAEVPHKFLVRLSNPHSFSAPMSFVSESHLSRTEQKLSLVLGIYFGLAGLAVAIAVLSAVSLRDMAYALYAPSVAFMALTQATMTGIAGLHLWPNSPWWNDHAALILPVLTVASLLLFVSAVVSMPERSLRTHRAIQLMAGMGVILALAVGLADPDWRVVLVLPYLLLATLVGTAAVLWAWQRGDRYSQWLMLGMLPVMLASLFPMARIAGYIPQSFATLHGMQLAIAMELPVLLVILMLRSQQRREHNRRMHGLDRVDPATGLINNHVFLERLDRMLARSQRLGHQSAVLLIEIANTEQLQREFGRNLAEEMPLRVAGRLLSAAREIDSVARLSDRRFGMLVEGPLRPEDATAAGPRIVARCLMPFRDKPADWVAQVHVVQALVPLDGAESSPLIARMEARLGTIPVNSKRTVFNLSDSNRDGSGISAF